MKIRAKNRSKILTLNEINPGEVFRLPGGQPEGLYIKTCYGNGNNCVNLATGSACHFYYETPVGLVEGEFVES